MATTSAPLIVFAPGIGSTKTGWPSRCDSFSARMRLRTSIAPPGLNGETRRIGLAGQAAAPCAEAKVGSSDAAAAIARSSRFETTIASVDERDRVGEVIV